MPRPTRSSTHPIGVDASARRLLASLLANLPFAVQPIQRGFEAIARDIRDAAACCGLSPWQRFVRIDAGQSLEAVRADVLATVRARTAAPGSAAKYTCW